MAETIRAVARRFGRAKLYFGHGTETAQDEAAWLVGHALRIAPERLAERLNKAVPPAALKKIDALTTARIQTRRPLAYLLKEAWFAGRKFYVDERVIVPRSLTGEFITEQFQPWIDAKHVRHILDLCTGSGCMAIACARAFPRARVDAADLSGEALAVARINIKRHRLSRRVRPVRSDLFKSLQGRNYDVIVTNPPYVARAEMKTLPREYLPRAGTGAGLRPGRAGCHRAHPRGRRAASQSRRDTGGRGGQQRADTSGEIPVGAVRVADDINGRRERVSADGGAA